MKQGIVKIGLGIFIVSLVIIYCVYVNKQTKSKSDVVEVEKVNTTVTSEDIKETTSEGITTKSVMILTKKQTSTKKTTTTTKKVTTTKTEEIKKDDEFETYIKSVLACEMPALYNKEALKAQAVAARTYAKYEKSIGKGTISKEDQCYLTEEEMNTKWGSNKDKYYNLISNAVDETNGLIMKKNGRVFKSYYFSTSNGYTENSMDVFGDGELTSVESIWDKTSKSYEVTTNFTKDEIISKLGIFDNIIILKRNGTNHVEQVMIDNKTITGVEFRKLLGLRSTDFYIDIIDNNYSITTHGYGHGVGMSQYGANEMAKQGKNYQEILKHYYGSIEITNS